MILARVAISLMERSPFANAESASAGSGRFDIMW
jgi:hypothetical protein